MLAKLTSKNQLTLPKSIVASVEASEYFEVEARGGQIVLTPVRMHRSDAVRGKLAELGLDETDLAAAVQWARQPAASAGRVSEPAGRYEPGPDATRVKTGKAAKSTTVLPAEGGAAPVARSRKGRAAPASRLPR